MKLINKNNEIMMIEVLNNVYDDNNVYDNLNIGDKFIHMLDEKPIPIYSSINENVKLAKVIWLYNKSKTKKNIVVDFTYKFYRHTRTKSKRKYVELMLYNKHKLD